MTARAVLVADDDPDFRALLRLLIESWRIPVVEAVNFTEVIDATKRDRIGLVLLDYFMPGDREAAVRSLRELVGPERIALCTACGDALTRAKQLHLSRVLPKPIDMKALEDLVESMYGNRYSADPTLT